MDQFEFHGARRMFFVKDRTVLVAPEGYPYSHVEWLGSLFGYEIANIWLKERVRGYVYNGRLVAYRDEFSHRVDHLELLAVIEVMRKLYDIKEIGLGAVPGPEQPWEPKVVYEIDKYAAMIKKYLDEPHA